MQTRNFDLLLCIPFLECGNERSDLTAFMQAERDSPSAPASINAVDEAKAHATSSPPALRAPQSGEVASLVTALHKILSRVESKV